MRFIIYCDFATLKCTRKEFAEKLETFCKYYANHNNYLWEIEIDFGINNIFIPYSDNLCESIYVLLSEFVSGTSVLKIFRVSESFCNDAP